jgi:hypothetical protein
MDKSGKNMKQVLKQKIRHEARELFWIFLYLALFLCTLATYTMLLLNEFHVKYFTYGAALLNALILSKVILLGEAAGLGKRHEDKPLFVSVVYKSLLFSLLVAALHVLEEIVKPLLHGESVARALHDLTSRRASEILVRNLVVFWAFIPLFTFTEVRRAFGEGKLFDLFFKSKQPQVQGESDQVLPFHREDR